MLASLWVELAGKNLLPESGRQQDAYEKLEIIVVSIFCNSNTEDLSMQILAERAKAVGFAFYMVHLSLANGAGTVIIGTHIGIEADKTILTSVKSNL